MWVLRVEGRLTDQCQCDTYDISLRLAYTSIIDYGLLTNCSKQKRPLPTNSIQNEEDEDEVSNRADAVVYASDKDVSTSGDP